MQILTRVWNYNEMEGDYDGDEEHNDKDDA
jgi:hypothetical protein